MPDELFSPVKVVTCIMVFEAKAPHVKTFKPYFGYLKEDGFIKKKNLGRIDSGKWADIKQQWISSYKNRESLTGLSITQEVKADDEWCAEAYMETDYSTLTNADFVKTIKNYVAFQFLNDDKL